MCIYTLTLTLYASYYIDSLKCGTSTWAPARGHYGMHVHVTIPACPGRLRLTREGMLAHNSHTITEFLIRQWVIAVNDVHHKHFQMLIENMF